jgi:flagellar hook-length control protein FliK
LPAVGAVSGSVQADLSDAHGESLTDGESGAATAVGQESRPIAGGRSTGTATGSLGVTGSGPSSVDVLAQVRESAQDVATVGGRNIARTAAEAQTAFADLSARVRVEDLRVARLATAADRMARSVALDPIVGLDALDRDVRQIERVYSKMPADGSGLSSSGGFGSQLRFSAEMIDSSSVAGAVEAPTPEMYVAEQVKYFISRDIQNAELKLKGFDELPIDVHISMHGNDAHIDFRTDNVEIREILQGAEVHLKDMLAKEGLVLSGVSVGTSLSDGRDARSPQPQQFTRQQVFATEDPNQIIGDSRMAPKSGNALDVFV